MCSVLFGSFSFCISFCYNLLLFAFIQLSQICTKTFILLPFTFFMNSLDCHYLPQIFSFVFVLYFLKQHFWIIVTYTCYFFFFCISDDHPHNSSSVAHSVIDLHTPNTPFIFSSCKFSQHSPFRSFFACSHFFYHQVIH